jgi:hypothetical protein
MCKAQFVNIFISIASYRDPELQWTIKSAIENANSPENLYFGVVHQGVDSELFDIQEIKNISIIKMHPKEARGAGYARAKAMELYSGEEYFLQIDSHTRFVPGWDSICIDQLNRAKNVSGHSRVLLSYFPAPFEPERNGGMFLIKNNPKIKPYPTRQRISLNKRKQWTAERFEFEDKLKENPELSQTVLGGFMFSDGSIVQEVPYDPEISFFGEEVCFAMRSWTRGWDIYSPSKNLVYHFYSRGGYSKIWKDRNLRGISWKEIEEISYKKQKRVLCGEENGIYGAGSVRTLNEYEIFTNTNFKDFYSLTNL